MRRTRRKRRASRQAPSRPEEERTENTQRTQCQYRHTRETERQSTDDGEGGGLAGRRCHASVRVGVARGDDGRDAGSHEPLHGVVQHRRRNGPAQRHGYDGRLARVVLAVVLEHVFHAGGNPVQLARALRIERLHAVDPRLLGGAEPDGADSARAVGAVAVSVHRVRRALHKRHVRRASHVGRPECHVRRRHARVDDVDVDPGAVVAVVVVRVFIIEVRPRDAVQVPLVVEVERVRIRHRRVQRQHHIRRHIPE